MANPWLENGYGRRPRNIVLGGGVKVTWIYF